VNATTAGRRFSKAAALGLSGLALSGSAAVAAPTDLDPSFGTNGRVTLGGAGDQYVLAIVATADGRSVYAGQSGSDALAFRLGPDGALDTGFGLRLLDEGGSEYGRAAAVQPDGKVVVVGNSTVNSNGVVFRTNADGSRDLSFAGDGAVGIDHGGSEYEQDVAIQPDGKIVIAGTTAFSGGARQAWVYRLNPDGSFDTSFDADGASNLTGAEMPYALVLQPDGKIVVTGYAHGVGHVPVHRLNADGSPDTTFDGDGLARIEERGYGYDLAVQADGRIVVIGDASGVRDYDVLVARLNVDGTPDTSFRDTGIVLVDNGADETASRVALQPDGRIVAAGGTTAGDDPLVVRLNPDGSRDGTFAPAGVFVFGNGGGLDTNVAMALQPDGKILLAGDNNATQTDAVVYRLQGGGPSPDAPATPAPNPPATPGPNPPAAPAAPARCAGKRATIVGTARGDRIRGTRRADVIAGLGGRDVIHGLDGNDVVCGGHGNDSILGGNGRDTLRGEAGADRLAGGRGRDRLVGGAGRDVTKQ
jgi:uncharacterized delta-60 repeat protein